MTHKYRFRQSRSHQNSKNILVESHKSYHCMHHLKLKKQNRNNIKKYFITYNFVFKSQLIWTCSIKFYKYVRFCINFEQFLCFILTLKDFKNCFGKNKIYLWKKNFAFNIIWRKHWKQKTLSFSKKKTKGALHDQNLEAHIFFFCLWDYTDIYSGLTIWRRLPKKKLFLVFLHHYQIYGDFL